MKVYALVALTIIMTLLLIPQSFPFHEPSIQSEPEYPFKRHCWAALICGFNEFADDVSLLYECLYNYYFFDEILYLGRSWTKSEVQTALNTTLAQKSDGHDLVFIYIESHGGGALADGTLMGGGRYDESGDEGMYEYPSLNKSVDEAILLFGSGEIEYYWDDVLAKDLDCIKCAAMTLVYVGCEVGNLTCFSGGIIDDVSKISRVIMTPCNETGKSFGYGSPWYVYSYWGTEFRDALTVYAEELAQYYDSLSMAEAFWYAWEHDIARIDGRESPWIDDNGNKLPTFFNGTDQLDSNDGLPGYVADRIIFPSIYNDIPHPWLVGNFNNDGIVDIFDVVYLAGSFGSYPEHPDWKLDTDLNYDNTIDIFDLVTIALNFGATYQSEGSLPSRVIQGLREETTSISVYPSQVTTYKHDIFTLNITLTEAANLYGWELKLYWNSAIIECTNAQIHTPTAWSGNTAEAGIGIENTFNATHGRFFKALSAMNPAPAFNGSMTIATLTFEAKAEGTTTLDLQDTKLSDLQASAISHSATDGSVTVLPPTWFMRGDQHTINLLTAYKLWKPQSSTMRYYYESKPIYELSAEWGIQIWKRSASGAETAISSGIVAQVTRTSPSQGLQSATWNCPETILSPTDAIVVRVYQRFEGFSWQVAATFITPQLGATKLNATTWTVYYYTKLYWTTSPSLQSKAYFYWGTTTYNSRTQNIEYT